MLVVPNPVFRAALRSRKSRLVTYNFLCSARSWLVMDTAGSDYSMCRKSCHGTLRSRSKSVWTNHLIWLLS